MAENDVVATDKSIVWGWILIVAIGAVVLSALTWKSRVQEDAGLQAATSSRPSMNQDTPAERSPFADWVSDGVAVKGGAGTAPDGSNTATKVVEHLDAGTRQITANLILDDLTRTIYAHVYAHAGGNRRLLFFLENRGELVVRCDVDLDTGKATFEADTSHSDQGCEALPDKGGWWRVQLRGGFDPQLVRGPTQLGVSPTREPFKRSYEGDGNSYILIWGGGIDTPDAHRIAPAGTVQTEFAGWRTAGANVEGGVQAPDGTATATRLVETAGGDAHAISATINIDRSKPVSASVSVHANSKRRLLLFILSGNDRISCDIDLASGQATMRSDGQARAKNCAATMQQTGWWRVDLTGVPGPAADPKDAVVGIASTIEPFSDSHPGDAAASIVVWGASVAQLPDASSRDGQVGDSGPEP